MVEGVRPGPAGWGMVCGVLVGISYVLRSGASSTGSTGSTGTGAPDPRVCKTDSPSLWGVGAQVISLRHSEISRRREFIHVSRAPSREPLL